LLAFASEEEVRQVIGMQGLKSFTPKTITRITAFRSELGEVRRRGYAVDDEEFEEGLRCVGAPVRDHSGRVIAAISITGPAFRLTPERLTAIGNAVIRAAEELSAVFGFKSNPGLPTRPGSDAIRRRTERKQERS
jgi:IclR family acetate operon transcriptional repressor